MSSVSMDVIMEDVQQVGDKEELCIVNEELVLFQLANETELRCLSSTYKSVLFQVPGVPMMKAAFNITLDASVPIDQPVRLLTFGIDPSRCDMVLQGNDVDPVHCTIWAQLNSGPDVLVISNYSSKDLHFREFGTLNETLINHVPTGSSKATRGIFGLRIGPYHFSVSYSRGGKQRTRLEKWFQEHEWTPVTKAMLQNQLGSRAYEWQDVGIAGRGANGEIVKKMEKKTGLLVAFKEFPNISPWQKRIAAQEIKFMTVLRHVSRTSLDSLSSTEHSNRASLPICFWILKLTKAWDLFDSW